MTAIFSSSWMKFVAQVYIFLTLGVFSASAGAQNTVTFFHNDILGSPAIATNADGAVVWKETYLPYGNRLQVPVDGANNQLWFAGKQFDPDTGLSYMGARYYIPLLGRFAGFDPKDFSPDNPHSFNRYAYANNNPYRYVDPDGKVADTVWDAFNLSLGFKSLVSNVRAGNWSGAAVDGVGITLDGAAAAIPMMPGGAAAGIAAYRAGTVAVKEVTLSRAIHGEAAAHAADAIKAGQPSVLTIDRAGSAANRQASIGGLDKVPGKHLDEYPPAMFREGGAGASVRPINPRDNMSAGACIGNACRGLPNGTRIQIKIGD